MNSQRMIDKVWVTYAVVSFFVGLFSLAILFNLIYERYSHECFCGCRDVSNATSTKG